MSGSLAGVRIQMLLDNPCAPDWRVQREAAALVAEGASVRITCWDRDCVAPPRELRDGVVVERVRTPAQHNRGLRQLVTLVRFYLRAWRQLRPALMDVVHVHDLPLLPLGVALARRRRVPLVYDAHEIYHVMESAKHGPTLQRLIARTEGWLVRRAVSVLITVSRQRVEQYWAGVVGSVPTVVVGNWYDPVHIAPGERSAARSALGVPADSPCVVYAGGLAPERRLDLLVAAAARRSDVCFLVAGRGDPEIEAQLAEGSRRLPNLRYLGWTDAPESLYLAASALYYVLDPSHPYSRFAASNTLYIAIARGLPLITSRVGEPGAIMQTVDQRLCMASPDLDTLMKAVDRLREPGAAEEIGARMASRQSEFTWEGARLALLSAYAGLQVRRRGR